MLCDSKDILTPASNHRRLASLTSTNTPPTTSLLHDPHDPRIHVEYQELVHAWTRQLLSNPGRETPCKKHPCIVDSRTEPCDRYHLTRTMDRYLDEQWVDSQHMLQCAQAWNMRESLSLSEAVHTVNILGLRMMQRALDARQNLYAATKDEMGARSSSSVAKPSFKCRHPPCTSSTDCTTSSTSDFIVDGVDSGDDDDDHEIHAPLLRRHRLDAISDSSSSNSSRSQPDVVMGVLRTNPTVLSRNDTEVSWVRSPLQKTLSMQPLRLAPDTSVNLVDNVRGDKSRGRASHHVPPMTLSSSAPTLRTKINTGRYHHSDSPSSSGNRYTFRDSQWKPLPDMESSPVTIPSGRRRYSSNNSSSSSQPSIREGEQWRSWFCGSHPPTNRDHCVSCNVRPHTVEKSLSEVTDATGYLSAGARSAAPTEHSSDTPSFHSVLAPEKTLLDSEPSGDTFDDNAYTNLAQSYGFPTHVLVRSESSISAFRPISKNLAPRCTPSRSSPFARVTESSSSSEVSSPETTTKPAVRHHPTPSKIAILTGTAPETKPLRQPVHRNQHKERNFMRSIVNKKTSISKLFAGKKL